MMMNAHRYERGQAVVLIVLAIIAMLGFVGLAVDGGRIYSEKRRAQNAADAAAYAAAMAAIENEDAEEAAYDQAALNDYTTVGSTKVNLYHPPIEGPNAGDDDYYQVVIEQNLGASFGRAIGLTEYNVKSVAVVHARPVKPVIDDNVIHALRKQGTGIEFKGNVTVNVEGGNIYSNSGIRKLGTSGGIHVDGGKIFYSLPFAFEESGNNTNNISPWPEAAPYPLFPAAVSEPDCGDVVNPPVINSKYSPGNYTDQLRINGGDIIFKPGMYCLEGGLRINGNANVTGKNVIFIVKGGHFETNGGANVSLNRPNDYLDASGNQWGGMLLYVPPSNTTGDVELGGNVKATYSGTVYAPDSWCRVGGNATSMNIKSNVICDSILFHGNPVITFKYKQPQNYQMPPSISLSE